MKIKNIKDMEYFASADGCTIAETFGVPTENIKEASIAYAILSPGKCTYPHSHQFCEWYIIIKGKADMTVGKEKRSVKEGDNIMIPKNEWHSICAKGKKDLEFYCFCVSAFTLEGTAMKDGKKPKESVKRNW